MIVYVLNKKPIRQRFFDHINVYPMVVYKTATKVEAM